MPKTRRTRWTCCRRPGAAARRRGGAACAAAALLWSVAACGGGPDPDPAPTPTSTTHDDQHRSRTLKDASQATEALLSESAIKAGLGSEWRVADGSDDEESRPEAFSGTNASNYCQTQLNSGCRGITLMGGAGYDKEADVTDIRSFAKIRLYAYQAESTAKTAVQSVLAAASAHASGSGKDLSLDDLGDERKGRIFQDPGQPHPSGADIVVRVGTVVAEIDYERSAEMKLADAEKLARLQTDRLNDVLAGKRPER